MRIIFFTLLFCMCSFHVFAQSPSDHELRDKLNKITKNIEKLEKKKDNLKPGIHTLKYPLGIPENKVEEEKRKIGNEIVQLEREKERIEQQIQNITYRIKEVIIVRPHKFFVDCPDIYLKINGENICNVHWDDWDFYVTAKDIFTKCQKLIKFNQSTGMTIEVWDCDWKYDNKLFTIVIDVNKIVEKVQKGNHGNMTYTVTWEQI